MESMFDTGKSTNNKTHQCKENLKRKRNQEKKAQRIARRINR